MGRREKDSYRSHAMLATTYVLPISSSAFRVLTFVRDCDSRDEASSMSSGGRAPGWRGMRLESACSIGLLMLKCGVVTNSC